MVLHLLAQVHLQRLHLLNLGNEETGLGEEVLAQRQLFNDVCEWFDAALLFFVR
jgi:hypothetical protein